MPDEQDNYVSHGHSQIYLVNPVILSKTTKKPDYLFSSNSAIFSKPRGFPSPDHSGFGFILG